MSSSLLSFYKAELLMDQFRTTSNNSNNNNDNNCSGPNKNVLCAYFCFTSFFRSGLKQIILIIHSSAEQVRGQTWFTFAHHPRPPPITSNVHHHTMLLLLLLLLSYYYSIFNNAVRVVWSQSISSTIVKRAFIYYYYYLLLYSRCGTHARMKIIIITRIKIYIYIPTRTYVYNNRTCTKDSGV